MPTPTAKPMPTHVVLRRFHGAGVDYEPGQQIRCEGAPWRNLRSLEAAKYIRPISADEMAGVLAARHRRPGAPVASA